MVGFFSGSPVGNPTLEAMGSDAIPTGAGDVFAAEGVQALNSGPTARLGRAVRDDFSAPIGKPQGFSFPVLDSGDYESEPTAPPADMMPPDQANERYGIKGRLVFDQPVSETIAKGLHSWHRDEAAREDIINRREDGLATSGAARFAAGLLGGLLDPINIAASFVPVVGEAKVGQWLAEAGSASGRAAVRAGVGAVEGATGAAALEPLNYFLAHRDRDDYTMGDALTNILMGSVMGGGLHVIGGAVADKITGKYANPITQRLEDAGPEAREAMARGATAAVAEGRPVNVAPLLDAVEAERGELGRAYDAVRADPKGAADDPLVHIKPEDIDGVIVSRGGWRGLGDVEVKGSGWGLIKFIWRHGEESVKPPEFQVTKDDVLSFPSVIREFEPSRPADDAGLRGREWRVETPGPDGQPRTLVFADNRLSGKSDRHLVSVYIQEPGKPGADLPLSARRPAGSPGEAVGGSAGDTAGDVLRSPEPVGSGRTTPAPENVIPLPADDNGRVRPAREALTRAAEDIAESDGRRFDLPEDRAAAAENRAVQSRAPDPAGERPATRYDLTAPHPDLAAAEAQLKTLAGEVERELAAGRLSEPHAAELRAADTLIADADADARAFDAAAACLIAKGL